MPAPEGYRFVNEDFTENFKWPEYIVFAAVLVASLGIGVFYGCFGSKNKSNEEFLMAGRSMGILPVTLSLVCSFVSAVTLLGNPVEVFYYGQVYTVIGLAFIPMTLALAYWYVPVYFDLQLTSAFEYFEWRFSRLIRTMTAIFGLIHLMFYQPITVLGPSLAIDQVAGFRYYISAAAIFLVCIAYSSLGGLKAVLWTDVLQCLVMFTALGSVSICGVIEVGGFREAWRISENTDRTNVLVFDPDPRTRHTVWTGTLGGYFLWLPLFAATQAQIQRYNSVPTLRQSRQCLIFNMIGMQSVILLCSFLGMLCYAKYHDCNPMDSDAVTSADQLIPLFVMDALRNYPVIPGLLVAGITCGSLSSVSSALNSLTAIVSEDFVKYYRPMWSDTKLAYVSKIVSTLAGLMAFGLLFVVKAVNSTINLSPFSTLIHGALLGPILGVFSLGMFIPWSNNIGVFFGMVLSIAISGFQGVGNIVQGRKNGILPDQRLTLSVEGCEIEPIPTTPTTASALYNLSHGFAKDNFVEIMAQTDWKELHKDDSFLLKIWSISYIWQPFIGCVSTLIFSGLFSFIYIAINRKSIERVHKNLLSKQWLSFWEWIFGQEKMSEWVDYSEEETFRKKTGNREKPNYPNPPVTTAEITLKELQKSVNGENWGNNKDGLILTKYNNNAPSSLTDYSYGTIPNAKLKVNPKDE